MHTPTHQSLRLMQRLRLMPVAQIAVRYIQQIARTELSSNIVFNMYEECSIGKQHHDNIVCSIVFKAVLTLVIHAHFLPIFATQRF